MVGEGIYFFLAGLKIFQLKEITFIIYSGGANDEIIERPNKIKEYLKWKNILHPHGYGDISKY